MICLFKVNKLNYERESLFVSYCSPHNVVTPQTLSRWVLVTMKDSGIDVTTFACHASRSAAATYQRTKLTCVELLKLADWSSSGRVYRKFYERYY